MRISFVLVLGACLPSWAFADDCPQPVYRGMRYGDVMRFVGETGATVPIEHGTIETKSPRHLFKFSTATSNGFSTEGLVLDNFKNDQVGSIVVRKNADFTDAEGPAAFVLTPELPKQYYYATNQEGDEALNKVHLDDTWKLVACGGGARRNR